MNRRFPLTAPLLLVLAACGPGDDTGTEADLAAETPVAPADTMPPPAQPEPMPADTEAAPTQGEALALLVAINEHEIAAAEQAREKQVDGEVMAYADMLHSDHTANLEATRELADTLPDAAADAAAEPAESPMLVDLRSTGEAELEHLSGLEGDEYEQAYIDAMVQGHQSALDMLDNQLIAAAQDAAVREHLTMTRDTIAAHLEQAQTLQSQLQTQ